MSKPKQSNEIIGYAYRFNPQTHFQKLGVMLKYTTTAKGKEPEIFYIISDYVMRMVILGREAVSGAMRDCCERKENLLLDVVIVNQSYQTMLSNLPQK